VSTAIVAAYTSSNHAYRTLVSVAVAFLIFSLCLAGLLALIRFPKLCVAVSLISAIGEWSAVRSVLRFRQDFDEVMPRPLAETAGSARTKTRNRSEPPPQSIPESIDASPSGPAVSSPPADARSEIRIDLSATSGDFPQFLEPDRNASLDDVELSRDWSTKPPERLWRQPVGAGWGGFSVVNGYAITLEQRGNRELAPRRRRPRRRPGGRSAGPPAFARRLRPQDRREAMGIRG
jgi:hypothetical protein